MVLLEKSAGRCDIRVQVQADHDQARWFLKAAYVSSGSAFRPQRRVGDGQKFQEDVLALEI